MAKLAVKTNASALEMAETMFGEGITITSAAFSGDKAASGVYSNGLTTSPDAVPADSGVILSTGKATHFTSGKTSNYTVSTSTSTDTNGVN